VKLTQENAEKEELIKKKRRILQIMQEKAKRIAKQRQAVQKYHDFLEQVRANNSDQYSTINVIVDRHKQLSSLQEKLRAELDEKEQELKTMKHEFIKHQLKMNTQTMQLNNEIANLKSESEKIDDEKNRLKSEEQENSQKQFFKITELSKILMAIDHLESFCMYRKLNYNRNENVTGGLNYNAINMQQDLKASQFKKVIENHFDSYTDRTEYALSQIWIIQQFLNDFQAIKDQIAQRKKEDS
jgi:hypothetical protein